MIKGGVLIPEQYESKAVKVAEGTYIQNIIINKELELNWIAVNNVSVGRVNVEKYNRKSN